MPLFGHKNKKQNETNDADYPADGTIRQDYADNQGAGGGSNYTAGTGGASVGNTRTNDSNYPSSGINDNTEGQRQQQQQQQQQQFVNQPAGNAVGAAGQTGHHHHATGGAHIGSAALREQGMLRDREAQNFHAQSEELAEAERLEQAAREHRERAVAQGAHPHNKFLGGNAALGAAAQPGGAQQTGTGQQTGF